MPSPSRCDSFAASPWPSICWIRLSLAAMPPVIARCAMTWRSRADHAERARPSAIEPRQLPDQPQRGREHEQHVDQRARTDGGDDRDALRGRRDQPARLLVERRHQLALGQPDHVGAVDDVAGMALQRGAGAGQLRVLMRHLGAVPARLPGSPRDRRSRALRLARACSFSIAASRTSPNASRATMTAQAPARRRRQTPARESPGFRCAQTSPRSNCSTPSPSREHHQSGGRSPEHRAPAQAPSPHGDRRLDRNGQQRRIGFRRDLHGAARRPGWSRRRPSRRRRGRRA